MAHFEKESMVKELSGYFKNSPGLIVANFAKVNVVEINALRRKLAKDSVRLIVAKNRLFRLALAQVNLEEATQYLAGTTGIALYEKDPVAVAKTLFEFSKDHQSFRIRGGIVDGKLLSEDRAKELSQLPNKNTLRAMVLMRMKSPITGLVNVLSGSLRGLIVVLDKISKQKEETKG